MIYDLMNSYSRFSEMALIEQFLMCFQAVIYLITFFAFITVIYQAVLIVVSIASNDGNSKDKRKSKFFLWLFIYAVFFLIISIIQNFISPNFLL